MEVGGGCCAVIGCGVVGLSTARLMQRQGWQVTIYARDLPPQTTSNVAGGQWSPFSVFSPEDVTPDFRLSFERACRLSHRYFQDLVGTDYGVSWRENLFIGNEPIQLAEFFSSLSSLFPDLRELSPEDHPFPHAHAVSYSAMQVQTPRYLAALVRDVRLAGGSIVVREFHDVAELARLEEKVILNCTGLGARELFGDENLRPAKGQLTVLLPQDEIDYNVMASDDFLYCFPRDDGVLLGGSWEEGVWDLSPNPEVEERVLLGHQDIYRSHHTQTGWAA